MIRAATFVLVTGLCTPVFAQSAYEQFNNGTAGWTTYGDGTNLLVDSAQGVVAPALRATDQQSGIIWGFASPPGWAGNYACAYGGAITFAMRISHTGNTLAAEPDVALIGGGLTLVFDLTPPAQANIWVTRSIPLLPSIGWRVGTLSGENATEQQIQQVLGSFESLRIRAEFSTATDTAWLDNVSLGGFRIDTFTQALTTCPGGDASFEIDALGSGPYLYQWMRDGAALEDDDRIEGAQAAFMTISGFSPSDEGTYICRVTNPCGSVDSAPIAASVCAGDFNCDDGIDDLDISSFFTAFENGDSNADINGDDGIDDLDISAFFVQFEAGC